jgi:putative ABC transport system permease protein
MFGSIPLGWLQLKAQKLRLVAAIMGIAFAVILIFVQLEFREALFVSAVRYHTTMDYDLAMLSPKTDYMISSKQFPRARLYQVLGFDGVKSATAVYMRLVSWRNPVDPSNARNIFVIGFDPSEPGFERLLSGEQREAIKIPDQVIFDRLGRDEYGPVPDLLDSGQAVSAEINDRRVAVTSMYKVGTSFGLDGGVITSDLNFLRILPSRKKSAIDLGLIKQDVRVLTRQEFMDLEIQHWNKTTPIGYIFAFGAMMGLIVGLIIVYQILFADVQDHLQEYATLKAMGYTHGYLRNVVLQEAIILAVLGFIPGMAVAHLVFTQGADATRLPLEMSLQSALSVFALTVAMCAGSGLIALRKLRAVDPADVF